MTEGSHHLQRYNGRMQSGHQAAKAGRHKLAGDHYYAAFITAPNDLLAQDAAMHAGKAYRAAQMYRHAIDAYQAGIKTPGSETSAIEMMREQARCHLAIGRLSPKDRNNSIAATEVLLMACGVHHSNQHVLGQAITKVLLAEMWALKGEPHVAIAHISDIYPHMRDASNVDELDALMLLAHLSKPHRRKYLGRVVRLAWRQREFASMFEIISINLRGSNKYLVEA